MSTAYQIVFGNKEMCEDVESEFRFYKRRDISSKPQSSWMYEVFKESMNSRIIGIGVILSLYVVFTYGCYEIVTSLQIDHLPVRLQILEINSKIATLGN